jgi:hypothetical protein
MDDGGEEIFVKRWLTVPGRLLLIATVLGMIGLFLWSLENVFPELPRGRYLIRSWRLPLLASGAAFFGLASWVLESTGVQIFRRKSISASGPADSPLPLER